MIWVTKRNVHQLVIFCTLSNAILISDSQNFDVGGLGIWRPHLSQQRHWCLSSARERWVLTNKGERTKGWVREVRDAVSRSSDIDVERSNIFDEAVGAPLAISCKRDRDAWRNRIRRERQLRMQQRYCRTNSGNRNLGIRTSYNSQERKTWFKDVWDVWSGVRPAFQRPEISSWTTPSASSGKARLEIYIELFLSCLPEAAAHPTSTRAKHQCGRLALYDHVFI